MNSIEFILRRMARSVGLANERNHLRVASQLTHYLSEAEDLLGRISWKDVADIAELGEEHWKIKEIENQQDRLEGEIRGIESTNDDLGTKRDELELKSEEHLTEISEKKTEAMRVAISLMHEIEISKAAGNLTKKKYSGHRLKLKVLTESGGDPTELAAVQTAMDTLKSQYAIDKRNVADLTEKIRAAEEIVDTIEKKIDTLRSEARQKMAEMMSKVSKSSKLVADYTSRIGALDATKKALGYKIGTFLSKHANSIEPELQPVLKKYKSIFLKIAQLRQSIRYNRILAGREGRET